MKEIVKEHPLRNIVLRFDLSKQPAEVETFGLQTYYQMHDKIWEERKKVNEHFDEVADIKAEMDFLAEVMQDIERDLCFLELAVEIKTNAQMPPREDRFSVQYREVAGGIRIHCEKLLTLYTRVTEEIQWYEDRAQEIYDCEDWFSEEQHDALSAIFRNWENSSVDIIDFDNDREEFYAAWRALDSFQDEYFEVAKYIFDGYHTFQAAMEAVYRRFEAVDERIRRYQPRKG